jgi:uncharacterized repeat protein (TIGR03803 family)
VRQISAIITLTVLAALLFSAAFAPAQTFTTLYNFEGNAAPEAGVIRDPSGNLYGTTKGGGYGGGGVVYEVNSAGIETVLLSFDGTDGAAPEAPLARDSAGNLYGTTWVGGSSGNGTVFKIDTAGNETVLHSFTGGSDGCDPEQGLVMDKSGSLFGTTVGCDVSNGTIFKIDSAGSFTLLHSFAGPPSDGANPLYGHLTIDSSGNLYGLTNYGGSSDEGVLYKLSESGTLTVLHSFNGGTQDGCYPFGSVIQDNGGNLYGTAYECGSNNNGTIWKVKKNGTETVLHNFSWNQSDGCLPYAGVTRDSKGNLYGVTTECGANAVGALYKLNAKGRLTLLHSFSGPYGSYPLGEALLTTKDTLFGTTADGGEYGGGTVWSYVP